MLPKLFSEGKYFHIDICIVRDAQNLPPALCSYSIGFFYLKVQDWKGWPHRDLDSIDYQMFFISFQTKNYPDWYDLPELISTHTHTIINYATIFVDWDKYSKIFQNEIKSNKYWSITF